MFPPLPLVCGVLCHDTLESEQWRPRDLFFLRTPPCFFVHRQGRWIVPLLPPLPFSADQGRRGEKGGSSGTGGFRSCSMQPFELVGPHAALEVAVEIKIRCRRWLTWRVRDCISGLQQCSWADCSAMRGGDPKSPSCTPVTLVTLMLSVSDACCGVAAAEKFR